MLANHWRCAKGQRKCSLSRGLFGDVKTHANEPASSHITVSDMLACWWFEEPPTPYPWSSTMGSAATFHMLWSRAVCTVSCCRSKPALVLVAT